MAKQYNIIMRNWKIKANKLPLYREIMAYIFCLVFFLKEKKTTIYFYRVSLKSVRGQDKKSSYGKGMPYFFLKKKTSRFKYTDKNETSYFSRTLSIFVTLLDIRLVYKCCKLRTKATTFFMWIWTYHGEHNEFKGIFGLNRSTVVFTSVRQMNRYCKTMSGHV